MRCRHCNPGAVWKVVLVLYLIALGYLCFSSGESLPKQPGFLNFEGSDKLIHFIMFFPFPFLVCLSGGKGLHRPSLKGLLSILAFGLALGAVTELIQGMLPYRGRDIRDFAADIMAVATGCLILGVLPKAPSESSCGKRDCSGCRN